MANKVQSGSAQWMVRLVILAVFTVGALALGNLPVASAQKEKPAQVIEDHNREAANLKHAFGNMLIDLYFVMGELESQKPGLAGVKFVDVIDVTGKELLRFERSGDSWLIDPDTVFAYHIHKAK